MQTHQPRSTNQHLSCRQAVSFTMGQHQQLQQQGACLVGGQTGLLVLHHVAQPLHLPLQRLEPLQAVALIMLSQYFACHDHLTASSSHIQLWVMGCHADQTCHCPARDHVHNFAALPAHMFP